MAKKETDFTDLSSGELHLLEIQCTRTLENMRDQGYFSPEMRAALKKMIAENEEDEG